MPTLALGALLAAAMYVVYVLALYPLLLAVLARLGPRPIARRDHDPTVTVVLTVRDGERWIDAKLASLAALDYPRELLDVVVVSDGSTDHSAARARGFEGLRMEVLEIAAAGKWAAINKALSVAGGELLFFTDVRQPIDKAALRHLVACLGDPTVGAASGELMIARGAQADEESIGLYWRYEKWIRKNQSAIASVPGATGAVYLMRRELARELPPDCLNDDMVLPLTAVLAGARVVFEPRARAFDDPTGLSQEFRRKVRTLAGVYQAVSLLPRLLSPSNPIWFHFLSHKLGRLFLPHAMIVILVSSFFVPRPVGLWLLGAQAAFYILAALDPLIAEDTLLKRLSSPVRTFAVLQIATLWAASILFRPARSFWTGATVTAPAPDA